MIQPATPDVGSIDWSMFALVLLRPDCVERGLVSEVVRDLEIEVIVLQRQTVTASDEQILAHYSNPSLVEGDSSSEQHGTEGTLLAYAGRPWVVLLVTPYENFGHEDAATRVREIVRPGSRHSDRRLLQVVAEDAIESTATAADTEREFGIWLAPLGIEIWCAPSP
jgi:nucleoside-diphosphate kinase